MKCSSSSSTFVYHGIARHNVGCTKCTARPRKSSRLSDTNGRQTFVAIDYSQLIQHTLSSLFCPGLKPSFSANLSHRSPSFFFFRIHYMDSPDCLLLILAYLFLLFSFSVLHCLVVGSVRQIKLTHVGFRAHVKIASRIVSYRVQNLKSLALAVAEKLHGV